MDVFNFRQKNWRDVDSTLPWVASFNKWLRLSELPKLEGSVLYITSDYSGQDKQSPFETFSILITDLESSSAWMLRRREVRLRYLKDGRRMSFKALNDGGRRRALVPFLSAANHLQGVCLVVAIQKEIKALCSSPEILRKLQEENVLKATWRFRPFERMLRIVHLVSIMIGGLAHRGQNIYWISDEDDMFMTPARCVDLRRMMGAFTSRYVDFKLGELGLGTTNIDPGDRIEEDLAAVPDLAAGAVSEILRHLYAAGGRKMPERITLMVPESITAKTEILLDWLDYNESPLKRVKLMFRVGHNGKIGLGPFSTEDWSTA